MRRYDSKYFKVFLTVLILLFTVRPVFSFSQRGTASWYGKKFHGRKTASGEVYDMNKMSAAHKTLPFGTRLKVTDLETGRSIYVKVNDRGPFVKDRIIDLSKAAASKLGILKKGTAEVLISTVSHGSRKQLFIQAGAFRSRVNAQRMANKLKRFNAVVAREDGLYKVVIGPVSNGVEKSILDKLKVMNIKGVIRYVTD